MPRKYAPANGFRLVAYRNLDRGIDKRIRQVVLRNLEVVQRLAGLSVKFR
jgi:hypothetical protein